MNGIALSMLLGDRGKYFALVVGVAFGALLITQQASIFFGLLLRSTGPLQNIGQPDLWVADRDTEYIGNVRMLDRSVVEEVRSVRGVEWAVPLFLARAIVDLPDGDYKDVQIIGIDRSTMIGRPPRIIEGNLRDLRIPDAVMVQDSARGMLGDPEIGDRLILNDRRALVVGFCEVQAGLQSDVVMYTTFDNAIGFVPLGRNTLSYVLVGAERGTDVRELARRISGDRRLRAFTPGELRRASIEYIIRNTGIGVNFGITVALGLAIGLVVSGAIFYQFVTDNKRHFATLKVMGSHNAQLVRMILVQAAFAGFIGFGIGAGCAGAFSLLGRRPGSNLDAFFPWQLVVGAGIVVLLAVCLSSVLSIRKVLRLEPAMVFHP